MGTLVHSVGTPGGATNWTGHLDRVYRNRPRFEQLRARAMLAVYGLGAVASLLAWINDLQYGQHSIVFLSIVDLGLLASTLSGVILVWRGRDDLAVHVVPAAFVVFSIGTIGVGLDGRADRFFESWSKWYPVFIAANALFLARTSAIVVTGLSVGFTLAFYAVWGRQLIGTPHEIIPTDVSDSVSIEILTGAITVATIWYVQNALERARTELARNLELTAELEQRVADRTQQVQRMLAERQTVLDHMADGLVSVSSTGSIRVVNEQLDRLFDAGGVETSQAAVSALPNKLMDVIEQARASREPVSETVSLPRGRYAKITVNPVPEEDDGPPGVVALVRDVTLEYEVDRLKTEFIATVSHELRTPLTSVLGFSKMILQRLQSRVAPAVPASEVGAQKALEQVLSNLGIVVAEGERLTALINDVLDIAKMEAGQVDWKRDRLEPAGLVERAAASVAALFPEDGPVKLAREVQDGLPAILGDEHRLVQVLVNLLSNAAKFTERGTVTLEARRAPGGVELAVRDTGRGIAPADHAMVFERFRQTEDTLTDKPHGTGLGLPICRQIAHAHGTEIRLESALGMGARFSLVLAPADG